MGGANTLWGFVKGGTPRSHLLIHIVATTCFLLWRHRKTRTLQLLKGAKARQRRDSWRWSLLPPQLVWSSARLVLCAHLMTLLLENLRGRGGTLMRTGVSEVLIAATRLLTYGDTPRTHLLPLPAAATDF